MKTLLAFTVIIASFALDAFAKKPQLPVNDWLPKLGKEWVRRDDDGANGRDSWVNVDNSQQPGEVLAFVVSKVPPAMKVTHSVVGQTSIEAFRSNGSAHLSTTKGVPIADRVRHRYVNIHFAAEDAKHEIMTIEYTYVYEKDANSVVTMAHGYCAVVDETLVCIQHTSAKPITSDVAFGIVGSLLAKHLSHAGESYSYHRGKVLKSNR